MTNVAESLAELAERVAGQRLPLRIRAWDGSETGPPGAPAVVLASPAALRRLLWAPGELGLARAYVTGDLDVDGDLRDALRRVWALAGNRAGQRRRLGPSDLLGAARTLTRLGGIAPPPSRPTSEARPSGRLHSRRRDAQVIAHHYDLSNALYALMLDERMAYSCGYWTEEPDTTVGEAQRGKLDLICRKLDLRPGARLLDVGCGWGALAVHAAREYGATVTGVTLSAEQLAYGRERVAREGLTDLVELRLQDYRDIPADAPYDAVTAIEMGEHVGKSNYPAFLGQVFRLTTPGGRVLIQQMSRGRRHPGGGPFIERYIAPDMHMRPLHETLELIEDAGFEVRDVHALREHYARTIDAWFDSFERRFDEV
ncbi:MAG: class I SAM-dependent methyltransferase, partial [Frankiaceae bacterium]|nr:class I SAM-dependent methyltransferase [Frankiaceae bacterium]